MAVAMPRRPLAAMVFSWCRSWRRGFRWVADGRPRVRPPCRLPESPATTILPFGWTVHRGGEVVLVDADQRFVRRPEGRVGRAVRKQTDDRHVVGLRRAGPGRRVSRDDDLPSAWTAIAAPESSLPKSTVALPPVPKPASGVPSRFTRVHEEVGPRAPAMRIFPSGCNTMASPSLFAGRSAGRRRRRSPLCRRFPRDSGCAQPPSSCVHYLVRAAGQDDVPVARLDCHCAAELGAPSSPA